jgi:uncharacterized membrane protein (DUF2068 family)
LAPTKSSHLAELLHSPAMLRVIGVFKLAKSLLLFIAAVATLKLVHRDLVTTLADIAHRFHVAPGNRYLNEALAKLLSVTKRQLELLAGILAAYGVLFGIEGIGLLLQKHWAEWMVVISTSGLIPFEVFEMFHHFGWAKLIGFIINVAILAYLILVLLHKSKHKQLSPSET